MPKSVKFSQLSFSVKLILSLIALATFLLTILFVLIIPKMQKEQYEHEKKQVEKTIALNTQQLKLAVEYIINDGRLNSARIKDSIEYKVHRLKDRLESKTKLEKIQEINNLAKKLSCQVGIIHKNYKPKYQDNTLVNDGYLQFKKSKDSFDKWHIYKKSQEENLCPSITTHIVYSQTINDKEAIFLSCNTDNFYDHENNKEKEIKKYIQKSFSYTNHLHKGNTFLMWLNVNNNSNKPLYDINDKAKNNKYCISKLSNVNSINTGKLSAKQIIKASNDKMPISHFMNKENDIGNYKYKALTWVRNINNDPNKRLVFITTVYEEDLHNNLDSVFWKIFPAALLALILSIVIGFLLFKRFSRSLDILVKTSKEVRLGNLNLRSNIKGKDHIGELGTTFDLMLDSMQSNIKNLDLKVEQRTKELQNSLDEKNTLLKEIHHRVKNNLAFTINLIKLQKRKVTDTQTKNLLTDVQERIYIMELLHRKLYESKDLNSIPFKKYIKELVDDIVYTYDVKDLKLNIDIDEVFMDIEHALPCGLIINECITNSFKYAFTEKNNEFSIIFRQNDKKCYLEISDNGKGLPRNLDINKTKSLGLRLITSISKAQLLGDIKYVYDEGTKFIINFDIIE